MCGLPVGRCTLPVVRCDVHVCYVSFLVLVVRWSLFAVDRLSSRWLFPMVNVSYTMFGVCCLVFA